MSGEPVDLVDARLALDAIVVAGSTILALVLGALTFRRRTAYGPVRGSGFPSCQVFTGRFRKLYPRLACR